MRPFYLIFNSVHLLTAGNKPIVQVIFATRDSDIYISGSLYFKNKTPGSEWIALLSPFNNRSLNTYSFIIDPTKPPISGSSLADLIGCEIGWVVSVFDLYNPLNITFSFNLDIQQSGTSIMTTPVNTTETSDNVTISSRGDQGIFNGKFKF